jgi:hypothetical protein
MAAVNWINTDLEKPPHGREVLVATQHGVTAVMFTEDYKVYCAPHAMKWEDTTVLYWAEMPESPAMPIATHDNHGLL